MSTPHITPRRVLFVIGTLGRGGAEHQALLVMRALTSLGHETLLHVVRPPLHLVDDGEAAGLALNLPNGATGTARELRRIAGTVAGFQPDAVVAFLASAAWRTLGARMFSLRRRPACIIAERGNVRAEQILQRPAELAMRVATWRVAERIVVNSSTLAANTLSVDGTVAGKIVVVPNVLTAFPVDAQAARARLDQFAGVAGRSPVLGAVGSFQDERNYDLLAQALPIILRRWPSAHVVIIGRIVEPAFIPFIARFRRTAERLGVTQHVTLAGEVPHARSLISGFDAFVLPSKLEGSSNGLAEAVLSGVPIAAAPVADTVDLLGGAGAVSEGWTPSAFADAIAMALEDGGGWRERARVRAGELLSARAPAQIGRRWATVVEDAIQERAS
jgi:glycosyltransferase involved in cell wall biosynthesis